MKLHLKAKMRSEFLIDMLSIWGGCQEERVEKIDLFEIPTTTTICPERTMVIASDELLLKVIHGGDVYGLHITEEEFNKNEENPYVGVSLIYLGDPIFFDDYPWDLLGVDMLSIITDGVVDTNLLIESEMLNYPGVNFEIDPEPIVFDLKLNHLKTKEENYKWYNCLHKERVNHSSRGEIMSLVYGIFGRHDNHWNNHWLEVFEEYEEWNEHLSKLVEIGNTRREFLLIKYSIESGKLPYSSLKLIVKSSIEDSVK